MTRVGSQRHRKKMYCKVTHNADSLNTTSGIRKCMTTVRRKVEYKFRTRRTDIISTLQSVNSGSEARPQLVQGTLTVGK